MAPRYLPMVLASLAAIGCASQRSVCSLDRLVKPPRQAEVIRTHGVDFAVFPSQLDEHFSGCQHYWLGDGDDPKQMKKMMVLRFDEGQIKWLAAREPKKPEYSCAYDGGVLVEAQSRNSRSCPEADEFKLGPFAPRSQAAPERSRDE